MASTKTTFDRETLLSLARSAERELREGLYSGASLAREADDPPSHVLDRPGVTVRRENAGDLG